MDLERATEFLLAAQAQHSAMLQQQALTLKAHEESMRAHAAGMRAHEEALRDLDGRLVTITDLVGRLAQAELHLVADMRAADERSKASDERLNALIEIVDQVIRRNGKRE
ncbi:MAG: hypothetical protein ACRD2D_12050 [Terriglobales bacterium]